MIFILQHAPCSLLADYLLDSLLTRISVRNESISARHREPFGDPYSRCCGIGLNVMYKSPTRLSLRIALMLLVSIILSYSVSRYGFETSFLVLRPPRPVSSI